MKRIFSSLLILTLQPLAGQPQTLPTLQRLDSRVRPAWQVSIPVDEMSGYAVLRNRIVVLGQEGESLQFYSTNGDPIGVTTAALPLAAIEASASGDHLLGISILDEDSRVVMILDDRGERLWSAELGSALSFSPSGEFLLTEYDALDASQPPAAFSVRRGREIWTDRENPAYWDLAASTDGLLAYYRRDLLRVIDLSSAALLWEVPLDADPHHDLGSVLISRNGATIVVRYQASVETNREWVTQAYDVRGQLQWELRNGVPPAQTELGLIQAVSEDGRLVLSRRSDSLSLLASVDLREVARLPASGSTRIAAFSATTLALHEGARTRIVELDEAGSVIADTLVDDHIDFVESDTAESAASMGTQVRSSGRQAVVPRLRGRTLLLTGFELLPQRQPLRH